MAILRRNRISKDVLDDLSRSLIEQSPLGVYIVQEGRFRILSPEFLTIMGYSEDELLGWHPLELVHPDDKEAVRDAAIEMLKGQRVSPYQFRVITKNGSVKWILERVSCIKYRGKRATLGNFMDITDQIRVQEALRQSEALLNAVLSSSPLGITMVENMAISWANPSMATILGYENEQELVGKDVSTFCPSREEFERIYKIVETNLATHNYSPVDSKFIRKNGNVFHGELRVAPLEEKGEGEKFVGILSDISWRKEAEAALAAEREWLAVTLRSIGDGVICTDTDGRIVLMNRVAEELTGFNEKEALGKELSEVFRIYDEESHAPYEDMVKKVIESSSVLELPDNTVLEAKDGTQRLIGDSAAPVKGSDGQVLGSVFVFRDVTAKRNLEREIARMQKLEAVGTLAGGIAHDFNNMLMGILGYITLARMEINKSEKALANLQKAEDACMHTKSLSERLITFSSGGEPVRELTQVEQFLRDSVEFALSGSSVKAMYEVDDSLWDVPLDKGQMAQVIHNLVTNAVEAMEHKGELKVSAENVMVDCKHGLDLSTGNYVKISIKDRGCGISKDHLEKVFDPFFTTKDSGRGLGLSIAHSIVNRHGGQIVLDSTSEQGTDVQIYLPATQVRSAVFANEYEQGSNRPSQPRVLLMDDEDMVREVTARLLEQCGYQVEAAADGSEAVDLYRKAMESGRPFDAVILDLTVPGGMGGKEALQKLLEIDPSVKAVVSSGYSDDPVVSEFQNYGFKGCIVKPYNVNQLVHVLDQLKEKR